jgi:ABC-type proline/glycine betaine transport system permease subunit
MWTGGQVSFRRVKVICADFVSLIFSRHFRVQCSILRRCAWMFIEAVVGFEWVTIIAIIAVSSANVLKMNINTLSLRSTAVPLSIISFITRSIMICTAHPLLCG